MKKMSVVLCAMLVMLLVMAGSLLAAPATITLACENKADFPYVMGDGEAVQQAKPGISIEALKLMEERLGVEIKIVRMPWKRCMQEMQEGKVDGVFYASYKPAREESGAYPMKDGQVDAARHFNRISYVLYAPKGQQLPWDGKSMGSLSGSVGAPLGYSIVADLEALGVKVDQSPSSLNDFKKMEMGRIAAVAALGDRRLLGRDDVRQRDQGAVL